MATTSKYTVQYGQNIFDVCLTLYGSIEGLIDLFSNNEWLSIDTELHYGDILNYTPYYYEDSTVVSYFSTNDIIPANGTGSIYYKGESDIMFFAVIEESVKDISFIVSGSGSISVDWGDDSNMETVSLSSTEQVVTHSYSEKNTLVKKIRIYGSASIYNIDFSNLYVSLLFAIKQIGVESFTLSRYSALDINFISMLNGLLHIDFENSKIYDINSLISQKSLITLNIANCSILQPEIDALLIGLVKQYGIRRNCTVNIRGNARPSGTYKQPTTLSDPQTGMEAIWVLVNEHKESSGSWSFIVSDSETYTS